MREYPVEPDPAWPHDHDWVFLDAVPEGPGDWPFGLIGPFDWGIASSAPSYWVIERCPTCRLLRGQSMASPVEVERGADGRRRVVRTPAAPPE